MYITGFEGLIINAQKFLQWIENTFDYCKSLKYGVNIIQRNYGTALASVI